MNKQTTPTTPKKLAAHELRTFLKYPQLLLARSVYFSPSVAVYEAIKKRKILDLTPNKPYPITEVISSSKDNAIVRILDDINYPIKIRMPIEDTSIWAANACHLNGVAIFKLHSTQNQKKGA